MGCHAAGLSDLAAVLRCLTLQNYWKTSIDADKATDISSDGQNAR
jgi:hypothetical protein